MLETLTCSAAMLLVVSHSDVPGPNAIQRCPLIELFVAAKPGPVSDAFREEFGQGERGAGGEEYEWMPIQNIVHWQARGEVPADRQKLASFFAHHWGIVAESDGDRIYVLVHTTAQTQFVLMSETERRIVSTELVVQPVPQAPVLFIRPDPPTRQALEEFTSTLVGRHVAICIDGHVLQAPRLNTPVAMCALTSPRGQDDIDSFQRRVENCLKK